MSDEQWPAIAGERVVLRLLAAADLPWLHGALAEPSVAEFWDQGEGFEWVDELLDSDDVVPYVIEENGLPVGYVQWAEDDDPGYRSASMDLLLVTDAQGRGLGRDAVRTLSRWLIDVRGHHRIEIDPAAHNARAIRCYESVGFRPIGRARRREKAADGTWHDSLLMDLVAEELH